ncbi:hypothetical protein [Brachybacterium sp. SGAir0954]|uniref:DUF7302 family protein n=1 Tax=Brachybacterium sp. SGAir0954 TaxID=2571029 RepID=UPI00143D2D4F|nr:hypothetical protein [Brachybacterium sp. SGAir0954]
MIQLINSGTGKLVNVPEELVERFLAAGFKRPAAEERPAPTSRRRKTSTDSE